MCTCEIVNNLNYMNVRSILENVIQGGVDLEETIRRIIEADLQAQMKIKEAEESVKQNLQSANQEKNKIQEEVWNKAKTYVEVEKELLASQLKKAQEKGQERYQDSLITLENKFQENHDGWRKEIYERCLTSR